MSAEKCYVLVRADMSHGYQIVQAAHAVAELEARHPGSAAGRTMVVLSVPNQRTLYRLALSLPPDSAKYLFFEPDVREWTALAIGPSEHYTRFKDLKLAGHKPKRRWYQRRNK